MTQPSLKQIAKEAQTLIATMGGFNDSDYAQGVLELAGSLAFPGIPLAVSVRLILAAMKAFNEEEW